jgi:hypothetical protein
VTIINTLRCSGSGDWATQQEQSDAQIPLTNPQYKNVRTAAKDIFDPVGDQGAGRVSFASVNPVCGNEIKNQTETSIGDRRRIEAIASYDRRETEQLSLSRVPATLAIVSPLNP